VGIGWRWWWCSARSARSALVRDRARALERASVLPSSLLDRGRGRGRVGIALRDLLPAFSILSTNDASDVTLFRLVPVVAGASTTSNETMMTAPSSAASDPHTNQFYATPASRHTTAFQLPARRILRSRHRLVIGESFSNSCQSIFGSSVVDFGLAGHLSAAQALWVRRPRNDVSSSRSLQATPTRSIGRRILRSMLGLFASSTKNTQHEFFEHSFADQTYMIFAT
jgi:hypothetical protein